MASTYDSVLDNFSTAHADNVNEIIHAADINNLADAVNKIELYTGALARGSYPSVKARLDGTIINVRAQGAKGDGKTVTDGAMSSSTTLTSATAAFTAADVGKTIQVARALAATPADLYTTIATYNSATSVTVKVPPGFTGTGRTMTVDGTRVVTDAATTADSVTVTSATIAFTAADVGKQVVIAAVLPRALNTTIASYTNATTVVLSAAATRTFTGAQVIYGTNDTTALQACLVAARDSAPATVYFPKGLYLSAASVTGTGAMLAYANTKIVGDGWGSVIRTIGGNDNSGELLGINIWAAGSADPETNVQNVTISDLHLQGTTAEDGFYQYQHLLSMSAVSNVKVERVKFSNWRGDGCYLASATSAEGIERHNQHVKFTDCLWDGINRDNRNAVSIIDGDDVIIERGAFRNSTRYDMPGPVCLESNPAYYFGILRSIRVLNSHFWFCAGAAGAVNGYFWESQVELTNPFEGIEIAGCTFRNAVGSNNHITFSALQYPTDSTARFNFDIHHNIFFDGRCAMEIEGMRGVRFEKNWCIRAGTVAGLLLGWSAKNLDLEIRGNTFFQCGTDNGYAIQIHNADRTDIDGNIFENIGQPSLAKGIPIELEGGGSISQPTSIVATPFTTGGTLGAATRSYRLTSFNDSGQTAATTAVTAVTTGATARVDLTWVAEAKAAGTKVYGRAGGSELLMATLGPNVGTWSDTGAITPSGALPAGNTTNNGASSDMRVINNTFRQGSTNRMTQIARLAGTHIAALEKMYWANNTVPAGSLSIGPFTDLAAGFKRAARLASVVNVTLPPGGTTLTVDGVAAANGDRVLLVGQTAPAQNGVYIVGGIGTSVVLTRAGDANTTSQVSDGMIVGVADGAGQPNSIWQLVTTNPVTMDSTALRFTRVFPPYANPYSSVSTSQGPFMPAAAILENSNRYSGAYTNQAILATGTVRVFPLGILKAGQTAASVSFMVGTTASSGITNSWGGIARLSDRKVLAISATSTATTAANTIKTFTFATPFVADVDEVLVGFIMYQATTVPTVLGVAHGVAQLMAVAPVMCGTSNTGATTAVAVGATLTAFTGAAAWPYAYLG